MSNDTGGQAFPDPQQDWRGGKGMTLRDYFAAKAMQGLISRPGPPDIDYESTLAYQIADAMLKARNG